MNVGWLAGWLVDGWMDGWTEDGGWMPDQWMEKRADEAEGKRMEDGYTVGQTRARLGGRGLFFYHQLAT